MKAPIWEINGDFDEENIPDKSEFNDWVEGDYPFDEDDEYWVKGKQRKDCTICYGIGCPYCNNLGYTIKK